MSELIDKLSSFETKIKELSALSDLDSLKEEKKALEKQMQEPAFWQDQQKATQISKKHEDLNKEIEGFEKLKKEITDLSEIASGISDEELLKEIQDQVDSLEKGLARQEILLLFQGKHDDKNAIVSIHAGSGGTEAQDWAQMLLRMVLRYAEKKGWEVKMLDETRGTEAGIKSTTLQVVGRRAYGHLKSEHGTHRLVRISPFDAEKMRHTSFALIEVIPEIDSEDVKIDEKDLRIDTFMSGGKGGQSVNTTYSAVRVVHIPTGITVSCQNERSQLQNKQTALKVLQSKLEKLHEEEEQKKTQDIKGEHKTAQWGNQIRSYVLHPYKMVKDLRTRHESADPDKVLDGELDDFVVSFLRYTISNE